MAAARADQVAATSSSQQPPAPTRQASDAAPSPASLTHTPAPEQCSTKDSMTPPDSTLQGSAGAPSCSPEGNGFHDSMPGQATAEPAYDLTASAVSKPGDDCFESAPSVKEADSPAPRQEEDDNNILGPATTTDDGLHCNDAHQECIAGDQDIPDDQLETDPHEEALDVGAASGGVAVNRDEGRSQRPARTPLAALQEAVAPTMGSLSFKQAVHAKQSLGEL